MRGEPVSREAILELLAKAPYSTGRLAEWLKQPYPRVYGILILMAREGEIVRLPNPDRRWALERRVAIRKDDQPFAPAALSARKPKQTSSWWVGAEPDQFFNRARVELPRMMASKAAALVRGQVIADLGPRR